MNEKLYSLALIFNGYFHIYYGMTEIWLYANEGDRLTSTMMFREGKADKELFLERLSAETKLKIMGENG
jgi:hypothetical protein